MTDIKEIAQNAQKFSCECCAYSTDRKANYSRHMVSKKHLKKSTTETEEKEIHFPRKSKTTKIKKIVVETSTQTETDDETVISELTVEYNFQDKIKDMYENEIKQLREMYEKQIDELKEENELLKDNVELLQQEKEELRQEIIDLNECCSSISDTSNNEKIENELKIKDDTIYDLKCQVQDLQEFIDDNIKNVKSDKPAIEMKIEMKSTDDEQINEPVVKTKNKKIMLKPVDIKQIENDELPNDDELIKLRNELNSAKLKLSKINIEKYTMTSNDDKKKSKKMKNDNSNNPNNPNNPMEIYKKLCCDSKINNKIMNYSSIDKSNKYEITKMNIIKSINSDDHQIKPSKLYQQLFTSIINEMKSKKIKFIKCVDSRRNKFKIHDGVEWKKFSESEFEDVIKILTNYICNSYYEAISNTVKNIDAFEFTKIYKKSKEHFLSEEGTKSEIVLSVLNPLYDDDINFMKTMINLCKKICKNDNRKKHSKKSYDSDSDSESDEESDNDSDSDSESDEDD